MATRGYEFYLRVLLVSLTSERSKTVNDTNSEANYFLPPVPRVFLESLTI